MTAADLATRIEAAGLTLPIRKSGRAYGRRDLFIWLTEHGVACTQQEVRTMLEGRYWATAQLAEAVTEPELDDIEAGIDSGLHDPAAHTATSIEEALFKPELPAGAIWVGSTIQTKSVDGSDRWHRIKPAPESGTLPEADLNAFRQKLLGFAIVRDTSLSKPVSGPPVAFSITQSDAQLGKPGTANAVDNWLDGVDMAVAECAKLMDNGLNVAEILSDNGGDVIEGLYNYANQAWLLELNLIDQLDLAIDTRLAALVRMAAVGVPIRDISYESNHGEASRAGSSKAITTTTSDSHDIHISRQVEKLARLTAGLDKVEFVRPQEGAHGTEWFVYLDVQGTGTLFTHGHREHGKGGFVEAKAHNGVQKLAWGYRDRMHKIRLALTKHYHHFFVMSNADLTTIGSPALEDFQSSDYLLPGGVWSRPGVLSVVIGDGAGVQGWARPMVHSPLRMPKSA